MRIRQKGYKMKIVPLSEKQRRKIIKLVKPRKNDMNSYQNLNLLTAVYDEDKKTYLTATYYMSAAIKRTDERYNDIQYVLLTPLGCFSVSCKESAGKYTSVFSPLPLLLSSRKITEMIQYYNNNFSERRRLEKEIKKDIVSEDVDFTEWYLDKYWSENS